MRNNERQMTYVLTNYVGPRKRKSKAWGTTGTDLPHALARAREFLKENGGKFLSASYCACTCYDVDMSNGKVITMQEVSFASSHTAIPQGWL